MKDPLLQVKPQVRALKAYALAARPAGIKVNQNENPYELPEAVKRRVLEAALRRPWGRYPEFDPTELLAALARFAGWRPDGVIAGNGSNELIEALLLVTVGEGKRVVIPEPTFTLYALLTRVLGGEPVRVPLAPDFSYDAEALRRAQRESRASLTIVCSPNNPTGTVLDPKDVERLCAESEGLVVVDEAYHEFAGRSVVPLLERNPNLVVLRTFSKAMALAGLRVGYLMAAPALVTEIDKARLPYNLNFFSQIAALCALEEKEALAASVARLTASRDRLMAALGATPGLRVHPSSANFFLMELLEADPGAVFEGLYAQGILVRDVTSYPGLARCLRVSVGTDEENAALVAALPAALAGAAAASRRA
jgi:histidinol-phosphate aminotransferase